MDWVMARARVRVRVRVRVTVRVRVRGRVMVRAMVRGQGRAVPQQIGMSQDTHPPGADLDAFDSFEGESTHPDPAGNPTAPSPL